MRVAGYVTSREIGRGGMGVVYEATQEALGRKVALKLISDDLAKDEQFRERFKRESRIAASIEHENVVPVYDAGEDDGTLYLAMRFINGASLAEVPREQPLVPARVADLGLQIGAGLDSVHAAGLVHRDVKPANVLVSEARAYLTDFGLARDAAADSALTASGRVVGTLDYVSPEQIKGDRVDARADIYAFGCLLFHLLTGRVPFPRADVAGKIGAHLNDLAPLASSINGSVSREADQVLRRAMAKDPEERYLSAGDLARALTSALAGSVETELERTVAMGAAAPQTVAKTRERVTQPLAATEPKRARRWPLWAGGALAAVGVGAIAALAVTQADDGPSAKSGSEAGTSRIKTVTETSDGAGDGTPDAPPVSSVPLSLGTWSGDAVINYDDGSSDTFREEITIDSSTEGEYAGTSTAVQGDSVCTGPMLYERTEGKSYVFSYTETTAECINSSEITLRPRAGNALAYRETTYKSSSSGTLLPASSDAPASGGWPARVTAYAVILSSTREESEASSIAAAENAGVLYSSDHPGLTPGYWVAYVGPFETLASARAALPEYQPRYPDAYTRRIIG